LSDEETPDLTPEEPEATDATSADAAEPADAPAEEPAAEEEAPEEEEEEAAPVEEAAAEEAPAEVAEEPTEEAPAAEEAQDEAPAEEPAPAAEEEAPAEEPAPPAEEAPAPAAEEPAPAAAEEAAPAPAEAAPASPAASSEAEELPENPREKPEIPGLELEPIAVSDADQYLDAEAQAAAEAEAEAAAARARAEAEDEQARPIADAAIDLAAGARYTATGKRKTAVARVILRPGKGEYLINSKPLNDFFPRATLQRMIRQPLEAVGYDSRMDVVARMHGGGVSSQAGALRHGISRALIEADPNLRGELKRRGFLTRDPRVKERKKAGLKKARKRPQFSKR
jgi:small subunit ribosomal protein S9